MSRLSKLFIVVLAVALVVSFGTAQPPKASAQADNKALAQAFMDAVNAAVKSGDTSALAALVTDDYVEQGSPEGTKGIDYLNTVITQIATAFPDGKYEVLGIMADGDEVWVRNNFTGTNTGDLMGLPATGKTVAIPGVEFFTFKDGKLAKHESVSDNGRFYSQLGFTIAPPTAAAATPAS
jgi:steroid delta-isomerase-like uncharacterized protein